MRGEVYILVCVCRFAVDVELESPIASKDSDIQHWNGAVLLLFHSPTNAGLTRVEKLEKRLDVVIANSRDGVISLSIPKEDDIRWL